MRYFEAVDAEVVVPLLSKEYLIGAFVLKKKKSGDSYSNQDLNLLEILSHQAAVALDNALLYSDLEGRVKERTEQLNERNRYLLTLQQITKQIIQTIDFREVTQRIVNAVHEELGHVGGFLLLHDAEHNELYVEAVTQDKTIDQAMQKIGKDIHEVRGPVEDKSLSDRVLLEGKFKTTSKMSDVISPAVPAKIAGIMQRILKVNSLVCMPVNVEGKTVGVLIFALLKNEDEIRTNEIEIMQALADLVGIVLRNSEFYERLQKANINLQDANKQIKAQMLEVEELNEHLKQLDKAKTEFLSIASHQLRTPLSAIRGYLSLLDEGDFGEMQQAQRDVVTKTQENVRRLVSLVNDLLSLSRIEAGTGPRSLSIDQIDLGDLITQVTDELVVKAKSKKLDLVWHKPATPIMVDLDREKFEQVIMNLVDNALNYTPEGSVFVTLEDHDETALLKVHDTGIGLDSETISHLFTKFYRSTDAIKVKPDGTGIGLYIAKTIVEAHRGKIWLESVPGKGTTFFVELAKKHT
jgi:signal transduction histidine kinase